MAEGWWSNSGAISGCVAAYQPVGAASLAASYSNLQNPGTFDAAPGVAPTFNAATGWTFNGTTQYLTTGYTPPNQIAATLLVRFSGGATSGVRTLVGCSSAGLNLAIYHYHSGTGGTALLANGNFSLPASASSGVFGVAGNQGYLNGAAHGSAFSASGDTWRVLFIGANNAGAPQNRFSGNIQALAIYNTTLTAGQIATVTTLMNALPVANSALLSAMQHHALAGYY